ncbi:flippase [Halorubrum sp. AD140]|uniref:flippase n=1 Tax=Halorubrum sp. AD140 TaxID=3050073 RepID=UPI002ACC3FE0|nr:flippase [Halorubrum sp. AD140]MDZ5810216.1 flippase [Halorubrum sp. AD140]
MSLSDRITTGVKATLGANVVDAVANGLLMLVLTRYLLSPTEFGLLHYALSIIGVVAILGTIGLPSSAARYVTELSETDPDQVRYVVRFGLVAILGLSIAVGAGLALASPLIGRATDEPGLVPLLVLGLGYVLGNSLHKTFSKLFQAINRVDWSGRLKALSGVSRLAGAVLLVLAGFGAAGALAGYLVGFAVASAVGAVAFYRISYTTLPPAGDVQDGLKRRILEYSVPLTATRGANVLDKRIDTVLVGVFLGPVAVGYYTVARQVSQFAAIPATSLGYTISPTVGEQYADEDLARARRVYEASLRHVLLLYVPAAVGLVLVAEPTVTHVFGPDYADAAPVLQILAGYLLVNAINKVTSDGLDYLGRARSRAIVKSVTATANFLLNLALIPALGVVGAAVATVITYTVYTVTNVYIIHDELDLNLPAIARLLGGVAAVAAVMGGVVRLLVPQVTGIPTLLVVVGAGVAVWAVLSTLGGLLDVARIRRVLT